MGWRSREQLDFLSHPQKEKRANMSKSHTLDNVTEQAAILSKDKTPLEVGDVASEYSKKWEKQILDIIEEHRDYAPKYYVLQYIQKEHGHVNILRHRTFIRKTRPDPDWNTDCYSYDNRSSTLRLEWTLPPKESATMILRTPSQWDAFLVSSIQRFLSGELSAQESRVSLPSVGSH